MLSSLTGVTCSCLAAHKYPALRLMQAKVLPMKFLDGQLTMKTLKIISPQKFVCIQYMYVIYYVCMYVCICMYAVYVKTVVLTGKIGIFIQ